MKKSIPGMSLPYFIGTKQFGLKSCKIYLKNYDFCENVKFGAVSWKFDILFAAA